MKNMRRVISMMLVLMFALGCFAAVANASGTVNMITTGQAHMRTEPNKDSKKVATLPKGTILKCPDFKVDSRGVKWYFSCYETKKGWVDGWVSEKNLKKHNSSPFPDPTTKPHHIDKTKLITTGQCYLRKNADVDSKKLDTIPADTVLTTEKYEKDSRGVKWYYTKYDGTKGWVSERNLKHYHAPDPTAKPTPAPINYNSFKDAGYYMRVTASSLNMRMAPSSEYGIIETLYTGDVVYAVRTNGEWVEVDDTANGRHGYMFAKYLEKIRTPKTVYPMFTIDDVDDITDGEYPVAFDSANVVKEDGVVVMKNVTVSEEENFDIVDIDQLEVGDVIVIEGTEVVVHTLDYDNGMVLINGGNNESGYDLAPIDEDNCYRVWGYDDACTYSECGVRDFIVSENVEYRDESDLDKTIEANYDNVVATINASEYAYTPYDTKITVEDGEVTKILRIYTP